MDEGAETLARAVGARLKQERSARGWTLDQSPRAPGWGALTDIYNSISVLHQVPLGGEDFRRYAKLIAAANALTQALSAFGAGVRVSRRLVGAS